MVSTIYQFEQVTMFDSKAGVNEHFMPQLAIILVPTA